MLSHFASSLTSSVLLILAISSLTSAQSLTGYSIFSASSTPDISVPTTTRSAGPIGESSAPSTSLTPATTAASTTPTSSAASSTSAAVASTSAAPSTTAAPMTTSSSPTPTPPSNQVNSQTNTSGRVGPIGTSNSLFASMSSDYSAAMATVTVPSGPSSVTFATTKATAAGGVGRGRSVDVGAVGAGVLALVGGAVGCL